MHAQQAGSRIAVGEDHCVVRSPVRPSQRRSDNLAQQDGGTSGDGRLLELRSSGEPNPLSIGREKWPVSPSRVREGSRLGPIQRPHQQLPLRRAPGPVNDVSAIGRDVDVSIDAVERQRLLG